MRHAVLGPGGVGGLLAGALARSGQSVVLLGRPDAPKLPPRIAVHSAALGDFEVDVPSSATLEEPADVLWIAVKATQLSDALRDLPPERVGGARVVPLLNGIDHLDLLRGRYGDRAVAGAIRVEAFRAAPGVFEHRSPFAKVELAPREEARGFAQALCAELRGARLDCALWDSEAAMLWSKLTVLAPLALATTAARAPIGEVRAHPEWSAHLWGCAAECCAVAAACGAPADLEGVRKILLQLAESMKSSMLRDLEAGRALELDAIGGAVLRRARAEGVAAPHTEHLVEAIRAAERAR